MSEHAQLRYRGGPFAGGLAEDGFGRIDIRSPMGTGAYVPGVDPDTGGRVFVWEPAAAAGAADATASGAA
jgi:hypothetical protein